MPLRLEAPKPKGPEYPKLLKTLGDHLRARRLDLTLYQKDLARRFGVNEITIHNWETGKTEPPTRNLPLIMDFLGYCLYVPRGTFPEKLLAYRTIFLGLTRKELAGSVGVDESTVLRWERGQRRPGAGAMHIMEQLRTWLIRHRYPKTE